jgi:hypothetical protein
MIRSRRVVNALTVVLTLVTTSQVRAQTAAPPDTLKAAIEEYRLSPTTSRLERVVRLSAAQTDIPEISEGARRYFVRGDALFKEARNTEDFAQAATELERAVRTAPWWKEAWLKAAQAHEAAGDFTKAREHLRFYKMFELPEEEARKVQDKIYLLEVKEEKAARESQMRVRAAAEEAARLAPKLFFQKLKEQYNGARYEVLACSYAPSSVTFKDMGFFPGGGTEEECNGKHWYDRDYDVKVSFVEDGYITFAVSNTVWLKGRVAGTTLRDIIWESPLPHGDPHRCWVRLINGLEKLNFSSDRPVDQTRYNPQRRYQYTILTRR